MLKQGRQRVLEVLAVWVVFIAYAGQPAPDVNESHYLTKARSFWDPEACAGDLFLGSENTHWLFYALTGWLTRFCPLTVYAWIGRLVTWLLLAVAWRNLVRAVAPNTYAAVWTAPLLVVLIERGHLAGEWLVGGFEAKGIAYALVLCALRFGILGEWSRVWLCVGGAAAFHLLVGAWSALALTFCWFVGVSERNRQCPAKFWPGIIASIKQQRWSACWGLGLALPGMVPVFLSRLKSDSTTVLFAAEVQSHFRLAHHQYFPAFGVDRVAALSVLLVLFALVRWRTRLLAELSTAYHFGLASLGLVVCGIVFSAVAASESIWSPWAWVVLRLYWFRLADVAIPIFVCLGLATLVAWKYNDAPRRSRPRYWYAGILAMLWIAFGAQVLERYGDGRPRADRAALPSYAQDNERTAKTYRNWLAVCEWIRESTPTNAGFLTPPAQQTFKWYAWRREVFCWKDMPQDDARIVDWWRRANDVYFGPRDWPNGWFDYTDDEIVALAERYQADYLVTAQREYESRPSRLRLVYPDDPSQRTTYVVIKLNDD